MASIKVSNLQKRFGSLTVIQDLSLDVADGEFLVLLGPSGCGKSTLLRILAGLETGTAGEIEIGGRRVENSPPGERDIAFVFQSYALYPHLTVRQNIAFPLLMKNHRWWMHLPILGGLVKRRRTREPAIADTVDRVSQILGLSSLMDRLPRTLSGGQRQRVALGRAMVREPSVFLMDEPLSNLDAKLRTSMRGEISRLHARLGGTFVYVTHDQVEAMTMGSRIALMRAGVIQQIGSPRELFLHPANTFVARFVGTPPMNLFDGKLVDGSLRIGEADFNTGKTFSDWEDRLIVGARPGDVSIHDEPGRERTSGTVSLVEHLGTHSIIAVRLRGVDIHRDEDQEDSSIMISVDGYSDLRVDQSVHVSFDLAKASFFDPSTGNRIRNPEMPPQPSSHSRVS